MNHGEDERFFVRPEIRCCFTFFFLQPGELENFIGIENLGEGFFY